MDRSGAGMPASGGEPSTTPVCRLLSRPDALEVPWVVGNMGPWPPLPYPHPGAFGGGLVRVCKEHREGLGTLGQGQRWLLLLCTVGRLPRGRIRIVTLDVEKQPAKHPPSPPQPPRRR